MSTATQILQWDQFEEKATQAGRRPVVKDAQKFPEELGMDIKEKQPDLTGNNNNIYLNTIKLQRS